MSLTKVRWVVYDTNTASVLLVTAGDFYCLPGGRVEAGENLIQALTREIEEELWVTPIVWQRIYTTSFSRWTELTTDIRYTILNVADFLELEQVPSWSELSSWCFVTQTKQDISFQPQNLWEILTTYYL